MVNEESSTEDNETIEFESFTYKDVNTEVSDESNESSLLSSSFEIANQPVADLLELPHFHSISHSVLSPKKKDKNMTKRMERSQSETKLAMLHTDLPQINLKPSDFYKKKKKQNLSISSCSSMFAVTSPTLLEFQNFGCVLKSNNLCRKGKEKILLDNVNAHVQGGEVLAIMGPSGSGKTTLLECATLNNPNNSIVNGRAMINKLKLTSEQFKKHCYIVHQSEHLASRLTCIETLTFAAKNCIDDPLRLLSHVWELLECLGLVDCKDTIVGDVFKRGLSGGEQRRLSVGLALIKMPKFILLDEPTSGLDSTSALKTCKHLRTVASKYSIGVVMTIHQPNTKIFNLFSSILLLHKGKVAYFGLPHQAKIYFNTKGHQHPRDTSIPDHLLDIVQEETFTSDFDEDALDWWKKKASEERVLFQDMYCRPRPSMMKQIISTMHREVLLIIRDPMLYSGRCVAFGALSVFFGLVYIDSSANQQGQVLTKLWLQAWLVCVPCCMACVLIYGHSQSVIDMRRNARNDIIHPVAYLVAELLQVPMVFLFSCNSLIFGGYMLCNWRWEKFHIVFVLHGLTMLSFELMAELFSLVTPHFVVGMLAFIGTWFAAFLFCGLNVNDEKVMWPLKALCYLLPIRYGTRSIAYEELAGTVFTGAEECTYPTDYMCRPEGFYCPEGGTCFGITGEQVLDSLHENLVIYSSNDETSESILFLFLFCLVIKALYVMIFLWVVWR